MSCHDAGHCNGLQRDDRHNVDIALVLFNSRSIPKLTLSQAHACRAIIDSTCTPYLSIEAILEKYHFVGNKDLEYLIKVARDVDHMGIIGIKDEALRERALVGLMREYLQKTPKDVLLNNIEQGTRDFFSSINFYTNYAKDWASDNLEDMK